MIRSLGFALLAVLLCAALSPGQPAPSMQPPSQTFEGFVGDAVSIQFQVANPPPGGTPGPFAISGQVPPGLSFNTATGLLSGTLSETGYYYFLVSRTYTSAAAGPVTVSNTYNFAVDNRLAILTPTPLPPATGGVAVTRSITANLNAIWGTGASNLPSSVSFVFPPSESGQTLLLTGVFPPVQTPTTYTFTVYASYYAFIEQFIERTYTITINPPPLISATLPTGLVGQPYTGSLAGQGGTAPFSFSLSSGAGALPPGLSLNPSTGAITGAPSAQGVFYFVARITDSSGAFSESQLRIAVELPPLALNQAALPEGMVGSAYSATLGASNGTPPYSFSPSGGALPPGITLQSNGALTGVPTQAGQFTFQVTVTDSAQGSAFGWLTLAVRPSPLSVTTLSLAAGSVGVAYSAQLAAAGGVTPYVWSVLAGTFPPGLALDPGTGALSGTPTTAGSFTFTVQVTDSAQATATRTYTVRTGEPLLITTAALPEGKEGSAYQASLAATGGFPPYAFSLIAGSLPPGISLASDGGMSGAPSASGEFSFTAQVLDSEGQTAIRAFTLSVFLRPALVTSSLPEGRVADPYSATLEATGRGPFLWSVTSGALPPGLTLNAETGTISGTPTLHGAFTFEATVSDGHQPPLTASRTFTVNIALPPLPPLTITQLPETVPPANQPSFGLQLGQGFPAELNGAAQIEFTPEPGLPPDPAVRFANGAASVNFTIPAGQTAAGLQNGL
ncbi:MAG: putative Ig domain-containing protein [Bryobacteraceae bacterium]